MLKRWSLVYVRQRRQCNNQEERRMLRRLYLPDFQIKIVQSETLVFFIIQSAYGLSY